MRTKMVAGNWKMNMTLQEGVALATELKNQVVNPACAVVIGTPFIHLATVAELLKDSPIAVAAENCADKEKVSHCLSVPMARNIVQKAMRIVSPMAANTLSK